MRYLRIFGRHELRTMASDFVVEAVIFHELLPLFFLDEIFLLVSCCWFGFTLVVFYDAWLLPVAGALIRALCLVRLYRNAIAVVCVAVV